MINAKNSYKNGDEITNYKQPSEKDYLVSKDDPSDIQNSN